MCLCESAGLRGILRGMLTKLTLTNFKLFEKAEIELADRVVFVGPNNSGKTTALQALALWNVGVRKWLERRSDGNVPKGPASPSIAATSLRRRYPLPTCCGAISMCGRVSATREDKKHETCSSR